MRLFAVRVIKDQQPVGFFWAPDPLTLWWMVDSVCDPGGCEYVRIRDRAAITWDSRVNAKLGVGVRFDDDTGESRELTELREGLSFEYALQDFIFGEVRDGWVKLPYADEPGGGIQDLFDEMEERNRSKPKKPAKRNPNKSKVS